MSYKPVFLDVDSSIVERNLKITDNSEEDEFNKIFNVPEEQFPSKLIKPSPGFCVKTKEVGTDIKVFVNICKTDALPPPNTITEDDLLDILNTDDITDFRVPMSIGDLRNEKDKKNEEARVCDVAINEKFFETVQNSQVFKNFLMAIVFEGLSNKHNIFTTDERILLKNRKAFGTLQVHRIQQREIEQKMGKLKAKALIEEVANSGETGQKTRIKSLKDETISRTPEYRLFRKFDDSDTFYAEVKLPYVTASKDLILDVGEDRIVLESLEKKYFLDIYIPFNVYPHKVTGTFNKSTKCLTIKMIIQSDANLQ